MEEVRIVKRRTYVWPVVIALFILALVIAYVFFAAGGGVGSDVRWDGLMHWAVPA